MQHTRRFCHQPNPTLFVVKTRWKMVHFLTNSFTNNVNNCERNDAFALLGAIAALTPGQHP